MLLALDTANKQCAVCLYDDANDQHLAISQTMIGRGHAEHLLPSILEVFRSAFPNEEMPAWNRLTKVAVSIGPGSFTGLRVGVSVARAIGLSQNIPTIGISVFKTIKAQYTTQNDLADHALYVAQDARRDEIFFQSFERDSLSSKPPQALSIGAFVKELNQSDRSTTVIGSAVSLLQWQDLTPAVNLIEHDGEIDIKTMAELATKKSAPYDKPKPLYIRAADAKPQSPLKNLAPPPSAL